MKLGFNHLTDYLLHGVYFHKKSITYYGGKFDHSGGKRGTVAYETNKKGKLLGLKPNINKVITAVGSFHFSAETIWDYDSYTETKHIYKLILRPLSDFAGKRTGKDVMNELECSLKVVHEIWELENRYKTLNQISYECYMVMCKNLIDFNRLIKHDLAIDMNLNKTDNNESKRI